jgi:hypothetical protein
VRWLIALLSLATSAVAVTLQWDPNPEPDIAGYRIHYGPERGNPSDVIDVGLITTATVQDPPDGTGYEYAVSAYNTSGLESLLSDPVHWPYLPGQVAAVAISRGGNLMAAAWMYAGGLNESSFTTWYTGDIYQPHNYAYGSPIVASASGICTKLRAKCHSLSGTPTLKLSLYDASYNRISSATAETVVISDTATWYEVTLGTPVEIVSGNTYYVFVSASTTYAAHWYQSGSNGRGAAVTYSSFPTATLSATDETGTLFGRAMYVEDSASGKLLIQMLNNH